MVTVTIEQDTSAIPSLAIPTHMVTTTTSIPTKAATTTATTIQLPELQHLQSHMKALYPGLKALRLIEQMQNKFIKTSIRNSKSTETFYEISKSLNYIK